MVGVPALMPACDRTDRPVASQDSRATRVVWLVLTDQRLTNVQHRASDVQDGILEAWLHRHW
jgi:hypothetical protein